MVRCQKIRMPSLTSASLWQKTNRWSSSGKELFRLVDRNGKEFCLAPTHEETITDLIAKEIVSSKDLPVRLYQIGPKYRDELRPRFGLLRSREFFMKDLYTFDFSKEDSIKTYDEISAAYERIFERIFKGTDIGVSKVNADTGNIGGSLSHEYQILSKYGEDFIASCPCGRYCANVEKATGLYPKDLTVDSNMDNGWIEVSKGIEVYEEHVEIYTIRADFSHTFRQTEEPVSEFYHVVVPIGRKMNEISVKSSLKNVDSITITDPSEVLIEPLVLIDKNVNYKSVSKSTSVVVGDFMLVESGDLCSVENCNNRQPLEISRGIEIGHVFHLGTKYSESLMAQATNGNGTSAFIEMACFGIGISRLMTAIVESLHDKDGIVWPESVAPYKAVIISSKEKFLEPAEELCVKLNQSPLNRGEFIQGFALGNSLSFAAQIKISQLIGIPWIIIVGKSFESDSLFEIECRRTSTKRLLSSEELIQFFQD